MRKTEASSRTKSTPPKHTSFQKQRQIESTLQLREIMRELPPFASQFFVAIESRSSILTRLNYARDLRIFFRFLTAEVPYFAGKTMSEIQVSDLEHVTLDDLYVFLDYLNLYATDDDTFIENHERGKARKVAAIRSFFKHYQKKGAIKENVCLLLDPPKQHEKEIIRLSRSEIQDLLQVVETGQGLTKHQLAYHKRTVKRDMAIFTLFLTTGIRVSELVGIDVSDVDFRNNSFVVTRKGGARVILYFDQEAKDALLTYVEERKALGTYEPKSPMFLSLQGRRMTTKSVEDMVKKYTAIAVPLKKISPHKLRSTFGTMLYNETGDIYLVADVLGHKDVNTTRRHYAAQSDENRRAASRVVKLRDENR